MAQTEQKKTNRDKWIEQMEAAGFTKLDWFPERGMAKEFLCYARGAPGKACHDAPSKRAMPPVSSPAARLNAPVA